MSKPVRQPKPIRQRGPPRAAQKSWLDKKHSIRDIASTVGQLGKYVVGLINTQLKNYDFNAYTATSVPAAGTVVSLSGGMMVGTANGQYITNEIHAKDLQVRCDVRLGATPINTMLRIIIFQDTECAGSYPAVTDVLSTASVDGFYNIQNFNPETQRFNVLADDTYCIGTAWQQITCCSKNLHVPVKNESNHILFASPFNGSTAAMGRNNIFALAISDTSVTVSEPVLTMNTRLYYESF